MKICIASDHAGVEMKSLLVQTMKGLSIVVKDFGPENTDSVDYPEYAKKVAGSIQKKEFDFGILICGTGLGMCYTANRFKGIRAALCTNSFMAKMARDHNDANVLVLGARVIGSDLALDILNVFLNTKFSGQEKHARRINKINIDEETNC